MKKKREREKTPICEHENMKIILKKQPGKTKTDSYVILMEEV